MAHTILGLQVEDRANNALEVQKLLTEYGCNIKTRVGLHDVHGNHCSPNGIILLEMFGEEKEIEEFKTKIKKLPGVNVQEMIFR